MKKFKFSLESYLKTKEIEKDKKFEELNLIKNKLFIAIEHVERIKRERLEIENVSKELLKTGVSSIVINQFAKCISEKVTMFKFAEEELKEILNIISIKQDELKKIVSEIKSIEKLKDKQYEEYLELLKKETEQITEDFLNTNKKNNDSKLKF